MPFFSDLYVIVVFVKEDSGVVLEDLVEITDWVATCPFQKTNKKIGWRKMSNFGLVIR